MKTAKAVVGQAPACEAASVLQKQPVHSTTDAVLDFQQIPLESEVAVDELPHTIYHRLWMNDGAAAQEARQLILSAEVIRCPDGPCMGITGSGSWMAPSLQIRGVVELSGLSLLQDCLPSWSGAGCVCFFGGMGAARGQASGKAQVSNQ